MPAPRPSVGRRRTAGRYPDDPNLKSSIAELRCRGAGFSTEDADRPALLNVIRTGMRTTAFMVSLRTR
ncbi:hypothetical protein [Streptomyces iconiensis]|uniref:Transposase n=1 Tax=Streptomyces iconiensis TaxID=1384038 RepID=A0ABT7A2G4_9ACTN|nr:hypothetical protein [Streptomyces iconiensis]MDJ1135041.1 hypothetical protein [Streptomyces iconiensis]